MKTIVLIVGVLAVVAGLVWSVQGAGIFPYPASSFMINQSRWIWIGLATALGGVILVILSRRM